MLASAVHRRFDMESGEWKREGQPIADTGMAGIINQVFRTLLHTRLQYGLRAYQLAGQRSSTSS